MSNELAKLNDMNFALPEKFREVHAPMIARIKEALPSIKRDTTAHRKRHSQTAENTICMTELSKPRLIRHALSRIDRTLSTIKHLSIKHRRIEIEIEQLREKDTITVHEMELRDLDILDKQVELEELQEGMSGSYRKVTALIEQRDSIMKSLGITELTEERFEAYEVEHHIRTAFFQAITAARGRGGMMVDEGNHIYLANLGISGADAMNQIQMKLFIPEGKMIKARMDAEAKGLPEKDWPLAPGFEMVLTFLDEMVKRYEDCIPKINEYKGLTGGISTLALLTKEPDDG